MLFEAATGELPFDAHDEDEDRYEQPERQAEPVRSNRRVPVAFNDLVRCCFESEPVRRPTVDEIMQDLIALT